MLGDFVSPPVYPTLPCIRFHFNSISRSHLIRCLSHFNTLADESAAIACAPLASLANVPSQSNRRRHSARRNRVVSYMYSDGPGRITAVIGTVEGSEAVLYSQVCRDRSRHVSVYDPTVFSEYGFVLYSSPPQFQSWKPQLRFQLKLEK